MSTLLDLVQEKIPERKWETLPGSMYDCVVSRVGDSYDDLPLAILIVQSKGVLPKGAKHRPSLYSANLVVLTGASIFEPVIIRRHNAHFEDPLEAFRDLITRVCQISAVINRP